MDVLRDLSLRFLSSSLPPRDLAFTREKFPFGVPSAGMDSPSAQYFLPVRGVPQLRTGRTRERRAPKGFAPANLLAGS